MIVVAMLKANLFLLIFLSLVACGKKGESWNYALTPATYSLVGPFCNSTGESPAYRDVAQNINLFDFSNIKQHHLQFEDSGLFRTIKSDECSMTVKHTIHENKDGFFTLKLARSFNFEPVGCSFQVKIGIATYDVSSESTAFLQDSDAPGSDIPFEIIHLAEDLEMISADTEALNSIWEGYGCTSPDRIKWTLSRVN